MKQGQLRIDGFIDLRRTYINLFNNQQVRAFRALQQKLKEERRFILSLHNQGISQQITNFRDRNAGSYEIKGSMKKLQYRIIERPEIIISPYSYISEQSYSDIIGSPVNLRL